MPKRIVFLIITLVAAGCAKPLEVGSITPIKSNTGSQGLDVYEPKRQSGQSAPEFAGDQLIEIRSFHYLKEKGEVEIPGATCDLSAAMYSATMVTPAKVRVPLYRGQSSALSVSCKKQGYKDKMITVNAFDATRANRYASASGGGLAGVAVVAVFDALSDNTKNDWRYPIAKVVLEQDEPKKSKTP